MSDMTSTPQKGLDETPAGFRRLGLEWPLLRLLAVENSRRLDAH